MCGGLPIRSLFGAEMVPDVVHGAIYRFRIRRNKGEFGVNWNVKHLPTYFLGRLHLSGLEGYKCNSNDLLLLTITSCNATKIKGINLLDE